MVTLTCYPSVFIMTFIYTSICQSRARAAVIYSGGNPRQAFPGIPRVSESMLIVGCWNYRVCGDAPDMVTRTWHRQSELCPWKAVKGNRQRKLSRNRSKHGKFHKVDQNRVSHWVEWVCPTLWRSSFILTFNSIWPGDVSPGAPFTSMD